MDKDEEAGLKEYGVMGMVPHFHSNASLHMESR
jgi:hypothetical protein